VATYSLDFGALARGAARVLLIAASVAIGGLPTLWVGVFPGGAPPIDPAAAIGVVATAILGWASLVGVALGALATGAARLAGRGVGISDWQLATATIAFALGVTAQAAAGAAVVRKWVPASRWGLEAPGEILRFLLGAGPIASLVSASAITLAEVALSTADPPGLVWLAWWVGETLGVLVLGPAVLTWIGRPPAVWIRRRLGVGLPLVTLAILFVAGIAEVSRWEDRRREATFSRSAQEVNKRLLLGLQGCIDAVEAVHGLMSFSDDVTEAEFSRAAIPWTRRIGPLDGLGWHVQVAAIDVAAFERRVRAEGHPDFRVWDRAIADGGTSTDGDAEKVVMRFMYTLNPAGLGAIGINVLSIPQARATIDIARRTRRIVASPGFHLTSSPPGETGVVLYHAAFGRDAGRELPRGFAFTGIRLDIALADALEGAGGELVACLDDLTDPAERVRLAGGPDCQGPAPKGREQEATSLDFASRTWQLRVMSTKPLAPQERLRLAALSAPAFSSLAMFGLLMLTMSGTLFRIEAAVNERTRQLRHEIAERRSTLRSLGESEARLRTILDAVTVGVAYAEVDGRIRQANPAFGELTGYPGAQLLSMNLLDLLPREEREAERDRLRGMLIGAMRGYDCEQRYVRADGSAVPVLVRARLIVEAGQSPHVVAVVQDTSETERLHYAERARALAEAASKAKTDFLSRMSHDLRAPLNAILGFSQLLAAEGADPLLPRQRQRNDQIQEAGWHLLAMIEEVLDLARVDAGAVAMRLAPVDVTRLIRSCIALLEVDASRNQLSFEVDLAPGAEEVDADETKLRQVITNLLSNAVKYNRPGGKITVSTRADSPWVDITVADSGIGMSEAQLADLFQPFNRLGRDKSSTPGYGIGLVISRRLVEAMGGSLVATSSPGSGSRFTVTLRRAARNVSGEGNASTTPVS